MKRLLALIVLMGLLACVRHAYAITPRQLVEVADLANVVLSPDGRRVAFRLQQAAIERNMIDSAWYVQDVDGATPPRKVADGGYALQAYWGLSEPAPAVWSPDGRWIYYRAMVDGKIDVWRAAADGSRAEAITLDAADVREFSLDGSGAVLKYSVGATREQEAAAEQTEYDRGVRVDKTVPIGQPLLRSGYVEGRRTTQRYRDGIELERGPLLAEVGDRWKAIELGTGRRRDLTPSEVPLRVAAAANLPKGEPKPSKVVVDPRADRVALLTPSGDGRRMYRQPYNDVVVLTGPRTRQRLKCRNEVCRDKPITDIQWRPNTDELLFTVTDRAEGYGQSIFRWNITTDVVQQVVFSRGLVNGGVEDSSCGVSDRVLVCVAAEADRPPRLERIDLETGERHVLFEPNASLGPEFVATRFLRWEDASGHTHTGQFFPARRRDSRLPPLFVNYYRCSGFVRGGFGNEWPLASLAEQGISALCINYAPLPLDAVERYDQGMAVVRGAIELLAAAGEIDRTRIGMGGLSFGAEVTYWTVANSDLLTAASVSSVGQSPLGYSLRRLYDDSFQPALRKYWQLEAPDETPERWRRISLAFNLDRIRVPVLMQLPEHEYVLTIDYAVPLIQNHVAELYVFPEEAHVKFQPRHQLVVYERNLDWFRFWLLDEEDPDPEKAEQYARWRTMKAAQAVVPDSAY